MARLRTLPLAAAACIFVATAGAGAYAAVAVRATDFINSIGVNIHISEGIDSTPSVIPALSYIGARNIRDAARVPSLLIDINQATGAKVCMLPWGSDITTTISQLEQLAAAGALLAAEGPNEPNNFPLIYGGNTSGYNSTFMPVALFQRDLYRAVKSDPKLKGIPVFHSSESGGAEPDNAGLQFLTIPKGAGTLMPYGTNYADFANAHNYLIANSFTQPVNNNAWGAAAPGPGEGPYDGLYSEYGLTWHKAFTGYSTAALATLPKVTTETGWFTQGTDAITEGQQGKLFLNLFLAQYKRGWLYTFVYMLRDDPNQGYWGLFHIDYSPKLSATYLHNLTTILADNSNIAPSALNYSIRNEPATMHDLLIQKSNGAFELAVWDERVSGADTVIVNLGAIFSTVGLYDPTLGSSPTQTLSHISSVQLTLTDHPVIIEMKR